MALRYGTTSQEHLQYKPEAFSWEEQETLDKKTQEYLDRKPFAYDVANDPMYKQYKEQYAGLGNLAMQDAMGQTAALTGGYGNSYAQTAGQQTYQNYLNQVNQIVPDLYANAQNTYEAEGNRLYNEIALLENQKASAYTAYQNDLNDWYNYLNVLQTQEEIARENDRWERQFAASQAAAQASAYPDYIINRLEQGFDSDDKKMAYLVGQAQLGAITSSQMGRLASAYLYGDGADIEENDFVKANYRRKEGDYAVFEIGGNEIKLEPGINPYTYTKNPDTKNGTFSNGYQPDNVGGKALSKTGETVYVNGVEQNVWKTKDGSKYVWDGTRNRYLTEKEYKAEME